MLTLKRRDEAIETIDQAIKLHDANNDSSQEKEQVSLEAQSFNRIQYQNFLCSSLFMKGEDFGRVQVEAEKGIKLCLDFSYAPLQPEAKKLAQEFEGMKLKARAK